MKSIKIFLAVVIASAFTMTSCSNDDDNGISTGGEIMGKWNYARTITNLDGVENSSDHTHEAGCDKDYREFAAGTVFRDVVLYKNASNVCTEDAIVGTWAKNGNTLTVVTPNEPTPADPTPPATTEVFQITRLDGSELHYQSTTTTGNVTLIVTRVFTKN